MGKVWLTSILASSATIGVHLIAPTPVGAEDITSVHPHDAMLQVTSVSQLRDVQPTDWAFTALQSLIERYGCIAGYRDGSFRGDRPLTRFEFAAGLNACLDRINELIATASTDLVTREDLATIQRLQEEFSLELTALSGRVDLLEARTAELEADRFSPTTKLIGFAWMNLTGATTASGEIRRDIARRDANNRPIVEKVDDPAINYSGLVWLILNTSFTGKDLMTMQLVVGNGIGTTNPIVSTGFAYTWGTPFTDQTGGLNPNEIVIREFSYNFPISDSVRIIVGPKIDITRYFDEHVFRTFAATFNSGGSRVFPLMSRGAGAGLFWDINDSLKLEVVYSAENDEFAPFPRPAVDPERGLFRGTSALITELTVSPMETLNIRLLYQRATTINPIEGIGIIRSPAVGVTDDGFGGPLNDGNGDVFSVNFDWLITPRFGVFGRYGYGYVNLFPKNAGIPNGRVSAQAYLFGLAFPDLGKEGALATLTYMVPYSVTEGKNFIVSGFGDGGKQYEIEASYLFPLNDNMTIIPTFIAIGNPNNFKSNDTVFVGHFKLQFAF